MPEVTMITGETVSPPFVISSENLTLAQETTGRQFALRAAGADANFAKVELPTEGRRFIVLLVLARNGKVDTVVIPDNRTEFRAGDIHAFNASKCPY